MSETRSNDIFEPLLDLTPDQIACYFQNHGMVGERTNDGCPVALFLTGRLGKRCIVGTRSFRSEASFVRRMIPAAITAFIRNYDSGFYPFLERIQ